MNDKVNRADKLALVDGHFSPAIVGYVNDHKLAVVKPRGTVNTGDAGGPLTAEQREI